MSYDRATPVLKLRLEHLSKPFALEVFMRRPIEVMLGQLSDLPLELTCSMGID